MWPAGWDSGSATACRWENWWVSGQTPPPFPKCSPPRPSTRCRLERILVDTPSGLGLPSGPRSPPTVQEGKRAEDRIVSCALHGIRQQVQHVFFRPVGPAERSTLSARSLQSVYITIFLR